MPLKAKIPQGRAHYYLRGTVKAGKRSRSVYESTGIGAREPGAAARAEEIRLQRETAIYNELLYGAKHVVTFTQAAADYCNRRARRRVAENPAIEGQPDKEAEYVAKWIRFLRAKNVADIPLADFCDLVAEQRARPKRGSEPMDVLAEYFAELHASNALETKIRESNTYNAVMNNAAEQGWLSADFPKPDLPTHDVFATPVNKWLYAEEIRLLVKLAPKHLRIYVAGVFATGIRGGELLFISRRSPNLADFHGTGLNLETGREFFFLGWTRTKNRKPIIRTLPDWYVEMLHAYLETRTDEYDALVLTDAGEPYKRPRRQKGFLVRTAWKAMRSRAAAVVERLARRKLRLGQRREATRLRERAAILCKVTPHWGRHNAASHIVMGGLGKHAAMRAAGWRSERIVERYLHLAPEHAKDMANTLDFGVGRARRAR